MDSNNRYTRMQKAFYAHMGGTSNHEEHNDNHDYWHTLLGDLVDKAKWKGKRALDFGCGCGRNVTNMLRLCDWSRVDGVDLSEANISTCQTMYPYQNSKWFCNNGVDLAELHNENYDFVMSTIVLQHIPVYDIRRSLMTEILRVMKPGAIFSFQMGYGAGLIGTPYYGNDYHADRTNSGCDVMIENKNQVVHDLLDIGFRHIECKVKDPWSDDQHLYWIYVRCIKCTQ